MPSAGAWLLDTNILLRISKNDDAQHPTVSGALRVLVEEDARLCFTSQILGEFWNASTRPRDRNGFGLTTAETNRLASVIERDFELLPDSREVHDRWRCFSSIVRSGVYKSTTPGWPQVCTFTASRSC